MASDFTSVMDQQFLTLRRSLIQVTFDFASVTNPDSDFVSSGSTFFHYAGQQALPDLSVRLVSIYPLFVFSFSSNLS